ncbi:MAG TPA: amidohydrolase [Chloroflexi bacterium]|nr:amidohydrolase [Chloroflexota bacterium]
MIHNIRSRAEALEAQLISDRRDIHKYAESGWLEFRTASRVARRLSDLGYAVAAGREVLKEKARIGLPSPKMLAACWERALAQGGDPTWMEAMRGGFTGVVGTLKCGAGPVLGMRFDIDALDLTESLDASHRPAREGFASVNEGVMHACGHDGHVAVGLGVAQILAALKPRLRGEVRLIFQPAEEGVRGARAMVEAGVVEGVDYLVGHHLYNERPLDEIVSGLDNYPATTKFDAYLTGEAAHAGANPQAGRNALLAAATAAVNLHALPRHRCGETRINVGRLEAGSGRNVIPANARLVIETRGTNTELDAEMYAAAVRVLEASAAMYNCTLEIVAMGAAQSASSSDELARQVKRVAQALGGIHPVEHGESGDCEDFTYMMRRVQAQGGQATNIAVGAHGVGGPQHSTMFDFDEGALKTATMLLSAVAADVMYEA